MSQVYVDTRQFDKQFQKIVKQTIPEARVKGLAKAGMRLLADAITEAPTVPVDEGTLRGSGSVFVNNELVSTSTHLAPKEGTPATSHKDRLGGKEVVTVGFNTPYASRLHEAEDIKFKEPSAGKKFLSTKLTKHRKRYMKIVADTIKEAGR